MCTWVGQKRQWIVELLERGGLCADEAEEEVNKKASGEEGVRVRACER